MKRIAKSDIVATHLPSALGKFGAATLILVATMAAATPVKLSDSGLATTSINVRHLHLHAGTRDQAHRTLARLEQAALEVCGASGFSLREAKMSVRASTCWKNAVQDAIERIDDPLLAQTLARADTYRR